MHHLIFASAVFATYLCIVGGQSCTNPNGISGSCKNIYDCKALLDIVKKPNRSPTDDEFLRKSKCGPEGSVPTVCCPQKEESIAADVCYTPDGNRGRCVDVYQCKHIADKLTSPVPQDTVDFIRNSKCLGPTQFSVCCGPEPAKTDPARNYKSCKNMVSAYPPDPATGCCGLDSVAGNKIVGGTATRIDQYPWLALIDYYKDNKVKQLCGGTLISGRYVLTAGHCVAKELLNLWTPRIVRLGEYDVRQDGPDCTVVEAGGKDCTEDVLKVPIESILPHPEYDPHVKWNDIALIRLGSLLPYNDFIRPICLPQTDVTLAPPDNFTLFVAGWGAIDNQGTRSALKLHVNVPFVDGEQCQDAYTRPEFRAQLWKKQVCAGGEKGKDSCKGDSGGPLMYENGRAYEAIALVSFGPKKCALADVPGVYTKLIDYKEWIMNNIKP